MKLQAGPRIPLMCSLSALYRFSAKALIILCGFLLPLLQNVETSGNKRKLPVRINKHKLRKCLA